MDVYGWKHPKTPCPHPIFTPKIKPPLGGSSHLVSYEPWLLSPIRIGWLGTPSKWPKKCLKQTGVILTTWHVLGWSSKHSIHPSGRSPSPEIKNSVDQGDHLTIGGGKPGQTYNPPQQIYKTTETKYRVFYQGTRTGVLLTVYPWYLLCFLGILGDYNP